LVLSGAVERLPSGALVELAGLAASTLAPGGTVVVVSADPRAWARRASPVEVDLAPGRPFRSETWCHLLTGRGLKARVAAEQERPGGEGLRPVPGADAALAANLEQLDSVLFPPPAYAVVATLPE
ncbi:MAG: hypothetical protein ACRD0S_07420, partial [Acidimicrobiales bacterium]